jgi:hexosaminidase
MPLTYAPLVPLPARITTAAGSLALPRVRIIGYADAAATLRADLARRTASRLPEGTEPDAVEITLSLVGEGTQDAYTLDTRGDGIRIHGHDAAGLFYGTRTLLQLLQETPDGWAVPRVLIDDAPRFAYRGVMLDLARHFFPVSEIEAYIDRASALKINHLHLHLTDDQGWRIQIDSWPLLAERASVGDAGPCAGGFLSKDDYRHVVEYAASRHMTVVPEVDLPGHTHAVGVAYPELVEEPRVSETAVTEAAALGQDLPVHGEHFAGWAVGHSSVRIHEERTYEFVTDVLNEIAEMTPGPYLHIGGDECLGTSPADFAAFIARVTRIVAATGKAPVTWHEAGAVADIAEGTVGQYWGSVTPQGAHAEEAAHFVARGGALIMSASDRTYLDMKPSEDFPLGLEWAGIVPLRTAYDWDPASVVPGVPESAILGVEAPLWTETVDSYADLEALAFPRLLAHAETAWSPQASRDWDSFQARVSGLA